MRRGATLALVSALLSGAAYAEDVLVIRDGTRRNGVVAGCHEDACTLDGVAVARGLIAWVGLRQGNAATPPARDPLKDEVHLVDGRVETGEFGGLSLGAVAIEDASFDRDEVAWIRFAGPEPVAAPRPSPGGPNYRFSPSPPASASPRPSPPPTPRPSTPPPSPRSSPTPTPRRGQPPTSGACGPVLVGFTLEDGGRWVGRMKGHHATGDLLVRSSIEVRLRECRYRWTGQPLEGVVEYSKLVDDGSVVTRNYSKTPGYGGPCTYTGAGTGRASGEVGEMRRTILGIGPRGDATWSEYDYFVTIVPEREIPYTVNCGDGAYTYGVNDPGGWGVSSATGPETHLPLTGGRMIGSYAEDINSFDSWSICREGTECPPLREPGGPEPASSPSPDPCGDLARARSLVDVLWDQRQSRTEALATAMRELQSAHDEMIFNLEAWRAAIPICAIVDIVQEVLVAVTGAFGEALDLAAQIAEGDLSYLNQSDGLGALVRAITGAGNPANMRDRIAGCAALPPNLRDAANAFVDNYATVTRLMPQVQQQVNWFRTQDQKYWDQWNTYYRDCLRHAQCKGLPASTCPQPPPTPSGPMPR